MDTALHTRIFGNALSRVTGAVTLSLVAACLGPQVDDTVPSLGLVLSPDAVVADVTDADPGLARQIAENDGVDGVVPALSAFFNGNPALYWDFGPAPDFVSPLYYLMDPDTGALLDHPPIFDFVPGDPQYSPFWSMLLLPVTDAYQGELIPSVTAVEEASRLGLVGEPMALDTFVNCPVVAADVRLDPGEGEPMMPTPAFVQGQMVWIFDINKLFDIPPEPLVQYGARVPVGEIFRLRRVGGEPAAEPVRGVDITGDGDITDTNDIIRGASAGVHLLGRVDVAVQGGLRLIEQTNDERASDVDSADDLFTAQDQPDGGVVAAIAETGDHFNMPWVLAP